MDAFLSPERIDMIWIDGKAMKVEEDGEILRLAESYPDWPGRLAMFNAWLHER